MPDKPDKLTTLDKGKGEKAFQGGYVPPPMKVEDRGSVQKGYVPPALKPPTPTSPQATPSQAQGEPKPQSEKTG